MSPDTFSCPECGVKLRRSSHLRAGSLVQCPKCSLRFVVPEESDEPPPPPPYLPRPEDLDPDREDPPRFRDPEDELAGKVTRREDDEPPLRPVTRRDEDDEPPHRDDRPPRRFDLGPRRYREEYDEDYPRTQGGSPEDLPEIDYKVTIGRWLSLAWQHYGAYFGMAIGYGIIARLISWMGQAVVGFPSAYLLDPPLNAGNTIVALSQLKGRRWKFGDFFGGFKLFGQTVGLNFLQAMAIGFLLAPGVIVGIVAVIADERGQQGNTPFTGIWICVVCCLLSLLVAFYVGVRLTFFALHLVIDRRFGIVDALSTSWKLFRGRTAGMMLFALTLFAINLGPCLLIFGALIPVVIAVLGPPGGPAGGFPPEIALMFAFMVSLLPMLLTAPYVTLAQTAAYLDAAGTELPVSREEADRLLESQDEDY